MTSSDNVFGLWTDWPLSICNLLIGLSLPSFVLLSTTPSYPSSTLSSHLSLPYDRTFCPFNRMSISRCCLQVFPLVRRFSSVPLWRSYWFHTVRRLSPPFTGASSFSL